MKRLLIKPSTTFYGQNLKKNIWTKQQKLKPFVNRNGTLLGYVQIRGENPYISPLTTPDAPTGFTIELSTST